MSPNGTRRADKAGSWYTAAPSVLSNELDNWLSLVPNEIDGTDAPIPNARVIIAPHAGYLYSGPCAAWAYKALDLRSAKRVFILGPSHTFYLRGAALSTFSKYATPFGDLAIDHETTDALQSTGQFASIPPRNDVSEHSLEMHLPYLWKRLEQTFGLPGTGGKEWPLIVPIMIGDNSGTKEKQLGAVLAPYLQDPTNVFIVSSDFCHWGERFAYTAYCPGGDINAFVEKLNPNKPDPTDPPIHESIKVLDDASIRALETGVHNNFVDNLSKTKNTVCGRHPIGVMMAALELARGNGTIADGNGFFKLVQYDRSGLVTEVDDSSVSYVSAYAIV